MAFDGVVDDGKLFAPGFANANPPGQSIFNLLGSAGTGISNAGASVDCTGGGDISMSAATGGGQVTVNSDGSITLASGITPTNGVVLIDADAAVDINSATSDVSIAANGGLTTLFVGVDNNITLNPTTGITEIFRAGVIDFVAEGVITNLSSLNGVAYPPPGSIPADITVSTLTAGDFIDVLALKNVSSINTVSYSIAAVDADLGLQNRLQIIPTSENLFSSIIYSDAVTTPSDWLPDNTTYQPISALTPGWGAFKQVGTTGASTQLQWSPYNPYYNEVLPYTVPLVNPILKKELNTLYAVIRTNNRINTQGVIFFNIYTYDITAPPSPSATATYTNRFDYVNTLYPTAWGGGITTNATLAGGYRYLIYACDTPKTSQQTLTTVNATATIQGNTYVILVVGSTNWTAIGAAVATIGCVFVKNSTAATGTGTCTIEVNTALLIGNGLSATSTDAGTQVGLKDPYDLYRHLPHIPFNSVAVASNSVQPADITNVAISKIVLGTTSSAITPTFDIVVEHIGYSGNKLAAGNYENNLYNLEFGSAPP